MTENPLLEEVKNLEEAGIEKPHSVYIAAMLAARGEPYCIMYDLVLFANAMDELLK